MQFKQAMERISNKQSKQKDPYVSKESVSHDTAGFLPDDDQEQQQPAENDDSLQGAKEYLQLPPWIHVFKDNSEYILNFLVPIGWSFLFVLIMSRESIISTIYMPFLGIFAATLANTVPIGGGIVYVPALLMLGVEMKLGVSFTVATMSFGNGLFGFLRWLNKNPTLIIWESFWYTVLPSWIGSIIGIFILPEMPTEDVKLLFAAVCLKVSILVALAAWKGGIDKLSTLFTYFSSSTTTLTPTSSSSSNSKLTTSTPLSSSCIYTLVIITFLGGLILVPNIGIGPALTTYLILNFFGYSTQSSVVTGIITGGWVCVLPFLIHIFYQQDIPYELWLMVIPGVYLGAACAPYVHEIIGFTNVLIGFAILLIFNAVILVI